MQADETRKSVEQFYDRVVDREVERLTLHRMEHAITRRALVRYLPPPPARIADVGEGGFTTIGLLACEGTLGGLEEQVNDLEGDAWEAWGDLNYRVADDSSIHGAADHLLYIGKKGTSTSRVP